MGLLFLSLPTTVFLMHFPQRCHYLILWLFSAVSMVGQLQIDLWVVGAPGKRLYTGADPLYNKGPGELWHRQVTRQSETQQELRILNFPAFRVLRV